MADTAIAITAGAGTNVDTRTEATNGNHRQVIVVGDPSTNAGVAPVDATNGLSVTLTTALPAGTAAIGKLAANSGVDIGDVDVASVTGNVTVVQGTGTNLHTVVDSGVITTVSAVTAITNALPAGTNAIGKLAANSGVDIGDVDITSIAAGNNNIGDVDVASIAAGDNNIGNVDIVSLPALPSGSNNIGDVDVLSIVPGTGATNLGKAEDAAHSSGDTGVMALVVRQDSHSDLGADGDYVPMTVDGDGGLRVSIVAGAGSGGTAAADDADFTAGTTSGTPAMGVFESSPSSVTDGDLGVVGITAARRLKTSSTIDAALPAGTNGIGKLTANSGVDIGDVDVTSIAAGDNNIGNVDIVSLPASTNTLEVVGDVADDAAAAGNPVRVGGFAISPDGTDPGSVSAEADAASLRTDLNRRLLVNTEHPRSLHKHLDGSTAYTDESLVADPGDGFQVIITSIIGSTGAGTALNFFLEEGSTKIFGPIYLEAVAGRGFCSGPIRLPVTASTAVTLTSSASIAQSFDVDYYIQAV